MSSLSQYERAQISERIKSTLNVMSYTRRLRTKAPYGYKFVSKTLPFEPAAARAGNYRIYSPNQERKTGAYAFSVVLSIEHADLQVQDKDGKCWWPVVLKSICLREGITFPSYDLQLIRGSKRRKSTFRTKIDNFFYCKKNIFFARDK